MASIRSRKLRSGRRVWQVEYRENGRRRHRQFAAKEQAEDFFAEARQRTRQARPLVEMATTITIDEFAERWLKQIENSVAARTAESYRQILDLYIRPIIGDHRMVALD